MCLDSLCCFPLSTTAWSTGNILPRLAAIEMDPRVSDRSSESPSSPEPLSLFVHVIGINEYASMIRSSRDVDPDTLTIKIYPRELECSGVTVFQMDLLCNTKAIRSTIIREFNNFATDQCMRHGDPILLYTSEGSEAWVDGMDDFHTNINSQVTRGVPAGAFYTLLSCAAEVYGDSNNVCRPKVRNSRPN
jgi:hypothetical protein